MLRRQIASPSVVAAVAGSARGFYNMGPDPIGKVHPDVLWGNMQKNYRGRGWTAYIKQLPAETIMAPGGYSLMDTNDRQGMIVDPEDPRHPLFHLQVGGGIEKGFDGAVYSMVRADWGEIPRSSRLLQLLYANYLEPVSQHRVCVHLMHWGRVPNNHHDSLQYTCDWIGEMTSLIGSVMLAMSSCVMDGVVARADQNEIYILDGVQVLEGCYLIADAPTTLHHYQRNEAINPYQTKEMSEGVIKIGMNNMIEPNCVIESCIMGPFGRLGHNSYIMKGVTTGVMVHIMPGSVVLADTHIPDGELWGGAPAVKLGKVSKFEWKKPYYPSLSHREMASEQHTEHTRYGDQVVHWADEMNKLQQIMVRFEDDLTPAVKAQIREFEEGKEPFNHTVARLTQGWSPAMRADDKSYDHMVPPIYVNFHANQNEEADSELTGSPLNWKHYLTSEKKW